jgi:23S rRNA (adenine2503-C2)-methyltransferase
MCDAGQECLGVLSKDQIFDQIDHMVDQRYPDRKIPCEKFKVQFTRMGEPVFNPAVLDVLEELPVRYSAPGLLPSFSTVGPKNERGYLARLKEIKDRLYSGGRFQMQFSIHTTDQVMRDNLIPIKKLSFEEIAAFGDDFFVSGDQKITLNFIVMKEYPLVPSVIGNYFNPDKFIIKLTPLNPTNAARKNALNTKLVSEKDDHVLQIVRGLTSLGFESLVSIGDAKENEIGSNCGQYVSSIELEKAAQSA